MISCGWFALVIVYAILSGVNVYAVWIYRKAFYLMKRTPMIRSVYYFLFALLIENVFFCISAIFNATNSVVWDWMSCPWVWALPKLFLLFALIYFVYTSLTPPDKSKMSYKECKEIEEIPENMYNAK